MQILPTCPRQRFTVWSFIVAVLLTACASAAHTEQATHDSLHWHFAHDPQLLEHSLPYYDGNYRIAYRQTGTHTRRINTDTQHGLLNLVNELHVPLLLTNTASDTDQPIAGLALAWAEDYQQQRIVFKLDERARWSDGHPVSGADFVYSFSHLSNHHYPWLTNIIATDDLVIFTIADSAWQKQTLAPTIWQKLISFKPLAAHFHQQTNELLDARFEPTTGPYHIDQFQPDRHIVLQRTERWWGSYRQFFAHRFAFAAIELVFINDSDQALMQLRHGNIDALPLGKTYTHSHDPVQALQQDRNIHQLNFHGIVSDDQFAVISRTQDVHTVSKWLSSSASIPALQTNVLATYRIGYYLPMTTELMSLINRARAHGIQLIPLAHPEQRLMNWAQEPKSMQLDFVWLNSNDPVALSLHPTLAITPLARQRSRSILFWPWIKRPDPLPVSIKGSTFHPWNLHDGGFLWLSPLERSQQLLHPGPSDATGLYIIEVADPTAMTTTTEKR